MGEVHELLLFQEAYYAPKSWLGWLRSLFHRRTGKRKKNP
jgi:hypothetical protein